MSGSVRFGGEVVVSPREEENPTVDVEVVARG